jgi:hypothetical protein
MLWLLPESDILRLRLRSFSESYILRLWLRGFLESEHLLLRHKIVDNRLSLLLLLCQVGKALDRLSWRFETLDGLHRLLEALD